MGVCRRSAARLAFTGSPASERRVLLRALALLPLASLASRSAQATEYATIGDVFGAIDRLEAEADARLRAIARQMPAARAFAQSVLEDDARHRQRRQALRERLRLGSAPEVEARASEDRDLDGLRSTLESLAYAHAEGLPALADPVAVDWLAHDMMDVSRQLTVVELWIALEGQRG